MYRPDAVRERVPDHLAPLRWAAEGQNKAMFDKVLSLAANKKDIVNEKSGREKQTALEYLMGLPSYHIKDKEKHDYFVKQMKEIANGK